VDTCLQNATAASVFYPENRGFVFVRKAATTYQNTTWRNAEDYNAMGIEDFMNSLTTTYLLTYLRS
jgi:hypothetical protein